MESTQKRRWVAKIVMVLAIVLIIYFIYIIWSVVLPFFFAMLFAYLLQPAFAYLQRKKVPPPLAITIIYLILFGLIFFLLFYILPQFLTEGSNFLRYLPKIINQIEQMWVNFVDGVERVSLPDIVTKTINNADDSLIRYLEESFTKTSENISNILRWLAYLALAPFLSYYMLRDKDMIKKKIIAMLSPKERPEILRIAGEADRLLRQFVYGYLLVSLILGVLTAIFLYIIGVEYALTLGLIMAVADLIPYFGPFIGAIPAIVIAYGQSGRLALITAIGMLALQQLEGSVITPKVMGERIGLHPLVTIFAVLVGGYLFGIIGTVLAVPVTATLILIIKYIYGRFVSSQL